MNSPSNPQDSELSRRHFLKSGAGTVVAGAIGGIAAQAVAQAQAPSAASTTPPPVGGPGIETQTGQAVYQLPRDHAWHGGAFYQSNEYNEWHYITALRRDLKTGERISVFWVPLAQEWQASEGRPLHNVLFAFHDLETGEFHTSMCYMTGKLKSEGSAADAKDFWFKYALGAC